MKSPKIYPQHWVTEHPYKQADYVDKYYAELTNKVIALICKSPHYEPAITGDVVPFATYLTLWFEDLISETNVWKTVNDICLQRYGSKLPFYDTTEYYDGEPNVCDLQLLIWHYHQTRHCNERWFNPENPDAFHLAETICRCFDEAYPDAPANERLAQYLLNPELQDDYWKCREVTNWFTLHSYVMVYGKKRLEDKANEIGTEPDVYIDMVNIKTYQASLWTYKEQNTLLAITPTEWLWRLRGAKAEEQSGLGSMRLSDVRTMQIITTYNNYLVVLDLHNKNTIKISLDSWVDSTKHIIEEKGIEYLIASTIPFKDQIYQCGIMSMEKEIDYEAIVEERDFKKELKAVHKRFYKYSNGEHILFYHNSTERDSILRKLKLPDDYYDFLPEKGALACTEDEGLVSIKNYECLKTPSNPFYDAHKAKNNAHFFFTKEKLPYKLACAFQQAGFLDDARMNSVEGDEHGHQLLQRNRQFFTDYFHGEHQ